MTLETIVPETPLQFRRAHRDDLARIVEMLADDPRGATRERYESPLPAAYMSA
jgi:hypothetical protein